MVARFNQFNIPNIPSLFFFVRHSFSDGGYFRKWDMVKISNLTRCYIFGTFLLHFRYLFRNNQLTIKYLTRKNKNSGKSIYFESFDPENTQFCRYHIDSICAPRKVTLNLRLRDFARSPLPPAYQQTFCN